MGKFVMHTLDKAKPGKSVTISSLDESVLKPRLLEMGLYEGKKLTVVFRAPFGDPIAVDVDGYILSMRLDEARLVKIAESSQE